MKILESTLEQCSLIIAYDTRVAVIIYFLQCARVPSITNGYSLQNHFVGELSETPKILK